MKTKLFFIALLVGTSFIGFAQSLVLHHGDDVLEPNEIVTVIGDPSDMEIVVELDVENVGSADVDVKVQRYEIDIFGETTINTFCWAGNCYPPFIGLSAGSVVIEPGTTHEDDFSGHLNPNGNAGTSIIAYTFFDVNNANDSVQVVIHYIAGTAALAQSLVLHHGDDVLEPNEIVTVIGDPSDMEIVLELDVENVGPAAVDVKVQRYEIDIFGETTVNTFCWAGNCYPPFIGLSAGSVVIEPGTTHEDDFSGHLNPNGNEGTSIIAYTFFDVNNANDSVQVVIHYIAETVGFDQSLVLHHGDDVLEPNEIVTVIGDPSDMEIVVELDVENVGPAAVDVKVQRYEIDIFWETTVNTFCWAGNCYPPPVGLSSNSVVIEPGTTIENDFSGHLNPNGNEGTSIIAYTFFDVNNSNDSVQVVIYYIAETGTVGLADLKVEPLTVTTYPNPATDKVNINSENTIETITVYNFAGQAILTETINNTTYCVNTSKLNTGIYLFQVETQEGIIAKRIIIE